MKDVISANKKRGQGGARCERRTGVESRLHLHRCSVNIW